MNDHRAQFEYLAQEQVGHFVVRDRLWRNVFLGSLIAGALLLVISGATSLAVGLGFFDQAGLAVAYTGASGLLIAGVLMVSGVRPRRRAYFIGRFMMVSLIAIFATVIVVEVSQYAVPSNGLGGLPFWDSLIRSLKVILFFVIFGFVYSVPGLLLLSFTTAWIYLRTCVEKVGQQTTEPGPSELRH